jgi:ribosomal protein S6
MARCQLNNDSANGWKEQTVKRFEGLFILNNPTKEDGIKDAIDKLTAEIQNVGGKIETVQKMDKKNFMRVADKKHNSGFYVNFIFEVEPEAIAPLRKHLVLNEDVFRVIFSAAPPPKAAAAK